MTASFSSIINGTLDAISDGIQIVSREWRYLYVNEAACRHGRRRREELVGRTMMECYPGIDETRMFRVLSASMQDRSSRILDNAFTYGDGSVGIFDLRIEPCPDGLFILSVDMTERRRLEAELRQAQKMDAIGRLAGGVAYDFNNLLTAMEGFAGLALDQVGASHPAAEDMRQVLEAVERAGALTRRLAAFSRESPVSARLVDLNGLVESLEGLLARVIGGTAGIVTKLSRKPCRALIDPGSFEQVIMNLVINGRDAMPGGGDITIETSNVNVEQPRALTHGQVLPAGEYVVLAVRDEGTGIEPTVLEMIFEPFFTTKAEARGTGLGLSTSYGIVRRAGGYIHVQPELGRGARFEVYLPRAHGPIGPRPASAPPRGASGHETILLVEEDWQVRQVAVRALSRCGYTVLSVASAREAVDALADGRDAPDLLLTDLTLHDGHGQELAALLADRCPGLSVAYMSGCAETSIVQRGTLPPETVVLAKPFSAAALVRHVRLALDEDTAPRSSTAAPSAKPLVLIVDDDEILRRTLRRQLTGLGCDVLEASGGSQAIHLACEASPSVIFVDLYMPGTDGHALLRRLPISGVRATTVVMSGDGNVDDVISALRNGACDYLKKPWSTDDLASALRRALDVYHVAEG